MNLFDRYLSILNVPRKHLQQVAVTCFWIACKFCGSFKAESAVFHDLGTITGDATAKDVFIELESRILGALGWDCTAVSALQLVRDFADLLQIPREVVSRAEWGACRAVREEAYVGIRSSCVAMACLAVAAGTDRVLLHIYNLGYMSCGWGEMQDVYWKTQELFQ